MLQGSYRDREDSEFDFFHQPFEETFLPLVDARFRKEALKGDAARSFLLGLDEDDICDVEIYFPGPLPLSMANDITIPQDFTGSRGLSGAGGQP